MPLSKDLYEDQTQGATIAERPDEDPTAGRDVVNPRLRTRLRKSKLASGRMKRQGSAR